MAKPDLGLKRTCVACSTKFYDMAKTPAICPKCGTEQPAEQPRPRRAALPLDPKLAKRAAAQPADGDEVEVEDVPEDETLDDAEDMDDAEDAIAEEIEVETERDEEP
ncbi:TIGR02300 family protein [Humitalea sp. 24SJ18S-53]|uniref:TIGR02300 family protein n=1 Tax=Humitalea sp. 24SJ18S-53 TaxID=3422307 RepID=UPI003D66967E